MNDSPDTSDTPPTPPADIEFTEKLGKLLEEFDINGVLIYQLPEDNTGEKPMFHSLSRGHFYDTTRLVSSYVKEVKQKFMNDLDGLM